MFPKIATRAEHKYLERIFFDESEINGWPFSGTDLIPYEARRRV